MPWLRSLDSRLLNTGASPSKSEETPLGLHSRRISSSNPGPWFNLEGRPNCLFYLLYPWREAKDSLFLRQPRNSGGDTLTSSPGTNPTFMIWVGTQSQIRSPLGIIIPWGEKGQESQGPVPIRRNEKVHLEASQLWKGQRSYPWGRKNPFSFRNSLWKVVRKSTNRDLSTPKGQSLLGQHFTSQSAPDIRQKLQKLQLGPQTLMSQLLAVAFGISNNHNKLRRRKELNMKKGRPRFKLNW